MNQISIKKQQSLSSFLKISIFGFVLLLGLVLFFGVYSQSQNHLSQLLLSNAESKEMATNLAIENINNQILQEFQRISQAPEIQEVLDKAKKYEKNRQAKLLDSISQKLLGANLDAFSVSNLKREIVYASSSPLLPKSLPWDQFTPESPIANPLSVKVLKEKQSQWAIQAINLTITNPSTGEVLGHLTGLVSLNNNVHLTQYLKKVSNSPIVLIAFRETFISSSMPLTQIPSKTLKTIEDGIKNKVNLIEGSNYFFKAIPLPNGNPDIQIILSIEKSGFQKIENVFFKTISVIALCFFLLYFLLQSLINHHFLKPLSKLTSFLSNHTPLPSANFRFLEFQQIFNRLQEDLFRQKSISDATIKTNLQLTRFLKFYDDIIGVNSINETFVVSAKNVVENCESICQSSDVYFGIIPFWDKSEKSAELGGISISLAKKTSVEPSDGPIYFHDRDRSLESFLSKFDNHYLLIEKTFVHFRFSHFNTNMGVLSFRLKSNSAVSAHDGQYFNMISKIASLKLAEIGNSKKLSVLASSRGLQLEATQKELIKTAHRAGMSEVITGVLHNIGNILTSLGLYNDRQLRQDITAEIIALRNLSTGIVNKSDAEISSNLDKVVTNIESKWSQNLQLQKQMTQSLRLAVNSIRSQQKLSKSSSLKEVVDLNEVIEAALSIDPSLLSHRNISLSLDLKTPSPLVTGSSNNLINVVFNLIKNSVEAIENHECTDRKIAISTKALSQFCLIEVWDGGEGLSEETIEKIFDYGFTTKESGHGFGLHVSKIAIEDMGGQIFAQSQGQGKGATFRIKIPAFRQNSTDN